MAASVPLAAMTPQTGARQPRVFPTASTIVKASTNSTTLATNAGAAAMASASAGFMRLLPHIVRPDHALRPRTRPRRGGIGERLTRQAWQLAGPSGPPAPHDDLAPLD